LEKPWEVSNGRLSTKEGERNSARSSADRLQTEEISRDVSLQHDGVQGPNLS
jgi:hypothetical protein